jgi:glycosyltransferase involved in cell wall biosynthesis
MTRIHAVCLVKNEEDVVGQALRYASQFCHRIYVFDTGSTDQSWERIREINNSVVVPFRQEKVSFYDGLRAQVFNAIQEQCVLGDWLFILDADEFLAEDPEKAIGIAEKEGADQINTLQYNFYFTDKDWQDYKDGRDSRDQPIGQRRRYYRFVNIEQRFFRITEDLIWPEHVDNANPRGYMKPIGARKRRKCSYRIPNRHYQYRDPEQIQLRLKTRLAARNANSSNFVHYQYLDEYDSVDWTKSIIPSHNLHYYCNDGKFKFTLSERVEVFKEMFGRRDFFRFDFLAN